MSRDVYEEVDFKKIEHSFIYQCAPVIAGLKISNLFIIEMIWLKKALDLIEAFGLSYHMLYSAYDKAVIFVFNREKTTESINRAANSAFFRDIGYSELSLDHLLTKISVRYRGYMKHKAGFPDELGILLGYPEEDVKGYIENKGKNYLYNGYWKVYRDVEEKKSRFDSFDRATEELIRKLIADKDIKPIVNMYKVA